MKRNAAMLCRALALAALASLLAGCATYGSSYGSRGVYRDGAYYQPADGGYGDYYYGRDRYDSRYRYDYGYPYSYGWPYYSTPYRHYGYPYSSLGIYYYRTDRDRHRHDRRHDGRRDGRWDDRHDGRHDGRRGDRHDGDRDWRRDRDWSRDGERGDRPGRRIWRDQRDHGGLLPDTQPAPGIDPRRDLRFGGPDQDVRREFGRQDGSRAAPPQRFSPPPGADRPRVERGGRGVGRSFERSGGAGARLGPADSTPNSDVAVQEER